MLAVTTPFPQYFDISGAPLNAGSIYIGVVSENPITSPVLAYWDAEGTLPAAQPIRTINGLPARSGSPAVIYVPDGPYSMTVLNKSGQQVFYARDSSLYSNSVLLAEAALAQATALAATSGAGLVGYGPGATFPAGTVGKKLAEGISSGDFPNASITLQLQAALDAAGGQGNGQRRVDFSAGAYTIANQGSAALEASSNTRVDGTGALLIADAVQNYYMIRSVAKSDVTVEHLTLKATATAGNDAQAALYWNIGADRLWNLGAHFNTLIDTSWGALISAETGSGSAWNCKYIGNDVRSLTPATKSDGLHMAGAIFNSVAVGNTVANRGDAGVAMNMTSGNPGSNIAVVGNALYNNAVGVDFSGTQQAVAVGNAVFNIIPNTTSNPALRAITYSGKVPRDILFVGNIALSDGSVSGENDVKFDTSGDPLHGMFADNLTRSIYIGSSYATVAGNLLKSGRGITVANNCGNVNILCNSFEDEMNITLAGNPGLAGSVSISRQEYNRANPANFLPTYSASNPFWAATTFLDGHAALSMQPAFVTSSAVAVDVPGSTFYLRRPAILSGISAIATLVSHPATLTITDVSNNVIATYSFNCVPGAGGTNVPAAIVGPAVSGNPYLPKVPAGAYKLRLMSALNAATLTSVTVDIWD